MIEHKRKAHEILQEWTQNNIGPKHLNAAFQVLVVDIIDLYAVDDFSPGWLNNNGIKNEINVVGIQRPTPSMQ